MQLPIDLSRAAPASGPKFTRPELLQMPWIPLPLSGVNPRSILGPAWWNQTRKAAYEGNAGCCWACGVEGARAGYRRGLEGHEVYDHFWPAARLVYLETVALCYSCHAFIHVGRLCTQAALGAVSPGELERVLRHGQDVLRAANLQPAWHTAEVLHARGLGPPPPVPDRLLLHELQALRSNRWDTWRMVIGDMEFPPKYADEAEVIANYKGEQR